MKSMLLSKYTEKEAEAGPWTTHDNSKMPFTGTRIWSEALEAAPWSDPRPRPELKWPAHCHPRKWNCYSKFTNRPPLSSTLRSTVSPWPVIKISDLLYPSQASTSSRPSPPPSPDPPPHTHTHPSSTASPILSAELLASKFTRKRQVTSQKFAPFHHRPLPCNWFHFCLQRGRWSFHLKKSHPGFQYSPLAADRPPLCDLRCSPGRVPAVSLPHVLPARRTPPFTAKLVSGVLFLSLPVTFPTIFPFNLLQTDFHLVTAWKSLLQFALGSQSDNRVDIFHPRGFLGNIQGSGNLNPV